MGCFIAARMIPELRPYDISLALEIAEAARKVSDCASTSTMNLKYEGEWGTTGLHLADVRMLRDPLRELVNWMTRQREVSLAEVKAYTGGNEWIAQLMVDELIDLGFVQPLEMAGNHVTEFISPLDMDGKFPVRSGNPWTKRCMNRRDLAPFNLSEGSILALWVRRAILNNADASSCL